MCTKRSLALTGIYLSVFVNSLIITVVYPIANKMTMYYGLVDNRTETGYWVGFLNGSVMLGRCISSPFWGILCDSWGRRPVLLLGIVLTSILSLLFGASTTYFWAVFFRFLQGLLSPIAITTRTIIGEMYLDKDQASGMGCFIIMATIGTISGNIIGGFFEEPKNFPIEVFNTYPFLLPNAIVAVIGIINLAICFFFMQETKVEDPLLNFEAPRSFYELFLDPLIRQALMLNCFCLCNSTAFIEIIALWAWAKLENGGFEFTPDQIGVVYALTVILYLFYIKFLYQKIVDKAGLINAIKGSLLFNSLFLLALPIITYARYEKILRFIFVILGPMVFLSVDFMAITSSIILINNSVLSEERGKINGFSMTLGNLARAISPPVYGFIFASTASSGWIFPLNFACSFVLLSLCFALTWSYARKLNLGLNHSFERKFGEVTSDESSLKISKNN